MVHLITGYAGYEHIQSEDDGAFNAAFFGNGQYVMETGNQFEGSIINNNTVRILDGDGLMYGRHFRIKPNTYEDLNITTGTAGTRRVDMICMTYEKNAGDGTEQAYLQVVKGAETSGTPAAPSYTDGNILDGATFNQMPLYKVEIEGVVLSSITALFDTIPTYKALAETYEAKFKAACQSHLDSLGVLDTMEEITANTQSNQLAGALGVKQIYNQLNTDLTPFFSDYNKKIADVTEASYTATENCLVICDLITTGAAYESMSISVNNLKIYIYQNIASQANIQSRTSYLLKAGDVIKISALTYAMYVYGRS